eukprot:2625120-Rhodomonas_salina.1
MCIRDSHHPPLQAHRERRWQDQVERVELRRGPRLEGAVRVERACAHADEALVRRVHRAAGPRHLHGGELHGFPCRARELQEPADAAVSYTHLTLPTICSV